MQVISGRMGQHKIHFEAPPAQVLTLEMAQFLKWFNRKTDIDGHIRAAIAHFWFMTIHPFDDGNGRVARAISNLALAQDEDSAKRCYSVASQISSVRKDYYAILEKSQRGSLDLTDWIIWFLGTYVKAIEKSETIVSKTLVIRRF